MQPTERMANEVNQALLDFIVGRPHGPGDGPVTR